MRHTQSLNGEWQLISDPNGMGVRQNWQLPEHAEKGAAILVPETGLRPLPKAGAIDWYYRTFTRPDFPSDHILRLSIENAGYRSKWWLNGKLLGEHEGSYTPFTLAVPSDLVQETNVLCARIDDGDGAAYRAAPPCGWQGSTWHARAGHGIAGDIAIESLAAAHIRSIFVKPDLRRKRITLDIESQGASEVLVEIEGTGHRYEGPPGRTQIEFPDFEAWTPETPHLYRLSCQLRTDGAVVDAVTVPFGMREFTIRDQRFYLNNHPFYLKGTRLPDGGASLPAATLIARIKTAQAMGFNALCTGNTPPSHRLLAACDELGLLVWGETAAGRLPRHAWNEARLQTEVTNAIEARRNHPSLVAWTVSSTLDKEHSPATDVELLQPVVDAARAVDPSRLIIDCGAVYIGLDRPSNAYRPYQKIADALVMLRVHFPAAATEQDAAFLQNVGTAALPHVIDSCGTGGLALPAVTSRAERIATGLQQRGLDRFIDSPSALAALAQDMRHREFAYLLDALRANENLSGYFAGYLYDTVEDSVSGYLDVQGQPKAALKIIAAAQEPVRPLVAVPERNLAPRDEVDVVVRAANDKRIEGQADLSLQVVGPTNQVLWKKKRGLRLSRSRKEIWSGEIAASGSAGAHRFVVRLMQSMKQLGQSETPFHVYDRPAAVEHAVNVVDPEGAWRERCLRFAAEGKLDAPIHVIPPLARTIRAFPDADLSQVLSAVREGAVALFFGPPPDWNDLASELGAPLDATTVPLSQTPYAALQYAKLHPIFENLPARCLMGDVYRHIIPRYGFTETADEDICGALDLTALLNDEENPWRSTLLMRRFGSGRIVFTHLDVLGHLGRDPVAEQLFVNLLDHFARRAVPSESPGREVTEAATWLRSARQTVRKWKVIGYFPESEGAKRSGIPNEPEVNLSDVYNGPYKQYRWETWHTLEREQHRLDLTEALHPAGARAYTATTGTAYAYAEFNSERRQAATFSRTGRHVVQVWFNGRPLNVEQDEEATDPVETTVTVRQGRNTLLVKIRKEHGSADFSVGFSGEEPVRLTWWR